MDRDRNDRGPGLERPWTGKMVNLTTDWTVLPGPRTSIVRGNCVRGTSVKRRNNIVQEIMRNVAIVFSFYAIIAIEHVFSMH